MEKYLTEDGFQKLKKELEYLEKVKTKEIATKIAYAASFGDLSENAAYSDAKEEQNNLLTRIAELKGIIRDAKIIEKKNNERVQMGSIVVLECDGEKEVFQILGSNEVNLLEGKISNESPLGSKLIGKFVGDTIEVGSNLKYKIIEIK